MMQAVARYGYTGASVARVVEVAGTSRATFYEHFANREDCFLSTQQSVAERALRCMGADTSTRVNMASVLEEVLVRSAENPAAARLLLVETLGATPAARLQAERFLARLVEIAESSIEPRHAPQLPASVLVDGVIGVIAARLLEGGADQLPSLADDFLAWARTYRIGKDGPRLTMNEWMVLGRSLTPAEPEVEKGPSLLPRGRSALDPAAGATARRRRIVLATAKAATRKGFGALTVADIVAIARVPRSAFYSQFAGKQEAFLAIQEEVLGEAMGAAAAGYVRGSDWPERVWNGLEGLLYYIAERPDLAQAGIVEVQSAGTPAIQRLYENCLAFTLFLEEGTRLLKPEQGDHRVRAQAIAFAIQGLMRRTLTGGSASRLPELLPLCTHVALAPFIGPRRSLEFVSERAAEVD